MGASEVIALYNGPFPLLSLLCLVQGSFPLLTGVVLSALLRKDSVSNFEVAMVCASVAGCVPGTIKLLHCGLADWAKEGPGQRSILIHFLVNGSGAPSLNLALTNSANRTVINSAIASTQQLGKGVSCLRDRGPGTAATSNLGFLLPSFSDVIGPVFIPELRTSALAAIDWRNIVGLSGWYWC